MNLIGFELVYPTHMYDNQQEPALVYRLPMYQVSTDVSYEHHSLMNISILIASGMLRSFSLVEAKMGLVSVYHGRSGR